MARGSQAGSEAPCNDEGAVFGSLGSSCTSPGFSITTTGIGAKQEALSLLDRLGSAGDYRGVVIPDYLRSDSTLAQPAKTMEV